MSTEVKKSSWHTIVTNIPPGLHKDLKFVAKKFDHTCAKIIRDCLEYALPKWKEAAEKQSPFIRDVK